MLILEVFRVTTPKGEIFLGQRYNRHYPDGKDFYDATLAKWLLNRGTQLGECKYEVLDHYVYSYENREIAAKKLAEYRKNLETAKMLESEPDIPVAVETPSILTTPCHDEIQKFVEPEPEDNKQEKQEKKEKAKKPKKEIDPAVQAERTARRNAVMVNNRVEEAKAVVLSLIDQGLPVTMANYNANKPSGRGHFGWTETEFATTVMTEVFKQLGLGTLPEKEDTQKGEEPKNG